MQAVDFQPNSYRDARLVRPLKQPCAFAFHFTASGRTNRTSLHVTGVSGTHNPLDSELVYAIWHVRYTQRVHHIIEAVLQYGPF